jgi:hypothetical protein
MAAGDLLESEHDPAAVRDLADEILSRAEYREPGESLLERIDRFMTELIDGLLSSLGFAAGGGVASWIAWLTLFALVAVVAALLLRVLRSGGWRRTSRVDATSVILPTAVERSSVDWLAEAQRYEADARWREALLARYRALVTELTERDVLPAAAGRTAGEYLRDIAGRHPVAAPSFAAVTELFEAVCYGGVEVGRPERDRFAGLAAATLSSLPEGDRSPVEAAIGHDPVGRG